MPILENIVFEMAYGKFQTVKVTIRNIERLLN